MHHREPSIGVPLVAVLKETMVDCRGSNPPEFHTTYSKSRSYSSEELKKELNKAPFVNSFPLKGKSIHFAEGKDSFCLQPRATQVPCSNRFNLLSDETTDMNSEPNFSAIEPLVTQNSFKNRKLNLKSDSNNINIK